MMTSLPEGLGSALCLFCFAFICFHNPGRRTSLDARQGVPQMQRSRGQG